MLNHLKRSISKDLKKQHPPNSHNCNSTVITLLKDHIKSLESETKLLRDEIKVKNIFLLSLISSKSIGNKYCESNNPKIANYNKSWLQGLEKENITPGKISGKKAEEELEPTKKMRII